MVLTKEVFQNISKENNNFVHKKYIFFIKSLLLNRKVYIITLIFLSIIAFWAFKFVNKIFFPPSNRAQFIIHFRLPEGSSINATEEKLKILEHFLKEKIEIENFVAYIGEGGPRFYLSLSPEQDKENYAFVLVNCYSYDNVVSLIPKVREFLRENIPYCNASVNMLETGAPVGDPIRIRISGEDISELYVLSDKIKDLLYNIPGVLNIFDDWGKKIKKLIIKINQEKAKRVNISSQDIAYSLKMQYDGEIVTNFREKDKNIPILIRSNKAARKDIEKIEGLNVYSYTNNRSIPLSQLAKTELNWVHSKIFRRNGLRTITVKCKLAQGFFVDKILKQLIPKISEIQKSWPAGYKYEIGGENEESDKAIKALLRQVPFSIFIIIMVMVMQFNSIRKVVIIIFTIPMGLIGVTFGLLIAEMPFGFMAMIGIISLAGIVVNNAIVLIDKINIEISKGIEQKKAVILATLSRTRPILLTSITTVGGLLPLAILGGDFWAPMAVTIMSGLIFSTILTLGFVPVLYSLFFKLTFFKQDFNNI